MLNTYIVLLFFLFYKEKLCNLLTMIYLKMVESRYVSNLCDPGSVPLLTGRNSLSLTCLGVWSVVMSRVYHVRCVCVYRTEVEKGVS